MNYCSECTEEMFLKRKRSLQMIMPCGSSLNGLGTRLIMQLNLLKNDIFSENLETSKGNPRKTWDLINELSSRNSCKSSNILEIQANSRTLNNADDMAEAFNVHFTNIAKMLARDIPVGEVDAESLLSPSDNSFSLKTPSIDIFLDLLKKNR